MIDWQKYGPSYTVAPGIKKIGDLPIIEFDDQEDRYLELKKKTKENIFFDPLFNMATVEPKVVNKIKEILKIEYPNKNFDFDTFEEMGYAIQEDIAIFHRSNKLIALHVSFPSSWKPKDKIGLSFASIHAPVPGMQKFLEQEQTYVDMMCNAIKPIIRYVWGEHSNYLLNPHEPLNGVKVMHTERQTFLGMPEDNLGIFFIRKKVIPFNDTDVEFQTWYEQMKLSMSDEQKAYKLIDGV